MHTRHWPLLSCFLLMFFVSPRFLPAQTQAQIDAYLKLNPAADLDKDGKLSRQEFLLYTAKQEKAANLKAVADKVKLLEDVQYARVGDLSLKLDLYLPAQPQAASKPPLVVWIHGGGWREFSKDRCLLIWLAAEGYAVASVQYRLAPDQGYWPAQMHDVKGAVRWLRAHAGEYGYDTTRIAAAGESAGGHLSLMLGTTAGNKELEGTTGGNETQSTKVDAVVNYYGPSDLLSFGQDLNQPEILSFLFNGPVSQTKAQYEQAAPINHVSAGDAPVLTLHGDKDPLVFLNHSTRMEEVYKKAGLDYTLHVIPGMGHGGPAFADTQRKTLIKSFLDKHLRGNEAGETKRPRDAETK